MNRNLAMIGRSDVENTTGSNSYVVLGDGKSRMDTETLRSWSWSQWFTEAMTPNFASPEAQAAVEAFASGRDNSPLSQAHQSFKHNAETHNPVSPSSDPLLSRQASFSDRVLSPLKPESVRTVSSSLISTALGTGVLSIPFALSLHGLLLGVGTLTVAAFASALSLQVLIVASRYTETTSYAQLLEVAVGHPSASIALDAAILLNGFGGVACLLIFEGDFLPAIFGFFPTWPQISRNMAILVVAGLTWPLSLPAELTALRHITILAPLALLLTAMVVFSEAPTRFHDATFRGESLKLVDYSWFSWFQGVALLFNAFTNQQNAVAAGNAMARPSVARIVKSTLTATLVVWAILVAVGVGGYTSWLGDTKGDFILNYPQDSASICLCRILLSFGIAAVIPVAANPTSASLSQLLTRLAGGQRSERGGSRPVSATVVMICCTLIAIAFTDVAKLIGVFAGFIATSIMFWFPAVIYVRILWPVQPRFMRAIVVAILLGCGCCGTASACVNAYLMLHPTE
jgi:amino acid permease